MATINNNSIFDLSFYELLDLLSVTFPLENHQVTQADLYVYLKRYTDNFDKEIVEMLQYEFTMYFDGQYITCVNQYEPVYKEFLKERNITVYNYDENRFFDFDILYNTVIQYKDCQFVPLKRIEKNENGIIQNIEVVDLDMITKIFPDFWLNYISSVLDRYSGERKSKIHEDRQTIENKRPDIFTEKGYVFFNYLLEYGYIIEGGNQQAKHSNIYQFMNDENLIVAQTTGEYERFLYDEYKIKFSRITKDKTNLDRATKRLKNLYFACFK